MRVALLQMSVIDGEPWRNLESAARALESHAGADLYLLPELWTSGYAHESWSRVATDDTPRVCEDLSRWSRERDAWIGGSMITLNEQGLTNRFWLFPPDGRDPVFYDKGHLFPIMLEDRYLVAGTRRVRLRLGGWTAAMSICFDLRFPEMYRRDAVEGADLFLVVSAWPHPRSAALRTLAQARAIENQSYLALCNRAGDGRDGTRFCGGSAVFGPDGTILVDGGTEQGVFVTEIDLEEVGKVRSGLPTLSLRASGLDW